jgi:hypothetical protein
MADDAAGHMLHSILNPSAEPGPPYTHTFDPSPPDPDEAVAWLREQIEGDLAAARIIGPGGYDPQRWDTDPPGQVNCASMGASAAITAALGPDADSSCGWVRLESWDRCPGDPEDVRESAVPVALVEDGRREVDHIRRHDPRNVVADCEAKLAILDACLPDASMDAAVDNGDISVEDYVSSEAMGATILRFLAAAYRHREGYARYWGIPPTHTITEGRGMSGGLVPFGLPPGQREAIDEAWASGRYTVQDSVNAMLAAALAPRYSPYFGTRPDPWPPPLPSRCYQSEYGFTVHIRGACECCP